jgi:hypothetical protein
LGAGGALGAVDSPATGAVDQLWLAAVNRLYRQQRLPCRHLAPTTATLTDGIWHHM